MTDDRFTDAVRAHTDRALDYSAFMTNERIVAALKNLAEMLAGTGAHADHTREQIGRCVHCSCGARAQGTLR